MIIRMYDASFGQGEYASEGFAVVLIDIQREIGWDPFKKTFRYFGSLSSSQVPWDAGEVLQLFLTKLKDYSGRDVLSDISNRDKRIIENYYGVAMEYVDPVYPEVPSRPITGGGKFEINVPKNSASVSQFTPDSSDYYNIYTSPFGGAGVSNDTYIEVYTNASCTGTPIASNDDYDGGRFSKVNVYLEKGTIYYIKVRHYKSGQVHADLNITRNIPIQPLTLDGYEDIITVYGEYAMFSFTPQTNGTYIFEAGGHNGGTATSNTYLKLYTNQSMTNRIGNHNNKIVVDLKAGHTYYLQFSGFLMKYAKSRIYVRQAATLEFKKRTDSSFIYVNSPEFITRYDIVDGKTESERPWGSATDTRRLKLFEQKNVTGKNTLYETHTGWYGVLEHRQDYDPENPFYIDIDFYNPTSKSITVYIENLAYGVHYDILQYYYNGGANTSITIPPYEHRLLFETLNAPLLCNPPVSPEWARTPVILFDFEVNSGNVTVSSLVAYNRPNLYLQNGSENILRSTSEEINTGEIICKVDENGTPIWDGSVRDPRPIESDLYAKYKGIAQDQSAWIDIDLELAVDDNIQSGKPLPVNLRDPYYPDGVANPKTWWMTHINPLNDEWDGLIYAMPGNQHHFTYHRDAGGVYNFAVDYKDLREINVNASGIQSVNIPVESNTIEDVKSDVALGWKSHFSGAVDEKTISMGAWGATYHYTITISNTGQRNRTAAFRVKSVDNMVFGCKAAGEQKYTTQFIAKVANNADWFIPATVVIPANSTTTFEIVTILGGGLGGVNNSIILTD